MALIQPATQAAGASAASGGTGSMPMPPGLIPVGNAVSATGNTSAKGGIPRPTPSNTLGGASGASAIAAMRSQYEPLPWTDFFDSRETLDNNNQEGRGYQVPYYVAGTQGHLFVCLHGAGHSAMSFALVAAELKATNTVVAFDWRGHGDHAREDETNMG
jgi:hypothetical protein